jgi:adenosylcobyric acid synthase
VLRRRGETPLPFKGQNMSLNAWVDAGGGEMAYSQAVQAWAAGMEPQSLMNPVLLKPRGDATCEVIHRGRSVGTARAEHYYRDWFRPGWQAIRASLRELQDRHPTGRLVMEGAGSPVEVNLQARDLTNLRLAQYLRARCLLVADIERGGVFAQIVGTLALLRPVERPLIRGILINRFRGRMELFDAGRRWLEQHTGLPVLGVVPWLQDLFPPEDSLDLLERRGHKPDAELTIAVVRLPSLSNFSDLDPLEAETSLRLVWKRPGEALSSPDAVLLLGSKQTLRDLEVLRESGMAQELVTYARHGGMIVGLCGGMQMLGISLHDPLGLEGGAGALISAGLGLLPLRTHFEGAKRLRQRRCRALWPPGESLEIRGFELHHGRSVWEDPLLPSPLADDPQLGCWQGVGHQGGVVIGAYLHGLFANGPWRRRWLNQIRIRRALPPLAENQPHHDDQRESLLDRLADAFEAHVDLDPLLNPRSAASPIGVHGAPCR